MTSKIHEKKIFTNIYWSVPKNDIVSVGMFASEESASAKIITESPIWIFQKTIPAVLQFEFNHEVKVGK